tara:strand:+ start:750 stop:1064 length:315 start_codon:yes stop_codon:yes gene_type:complete
MIGIIFALACSLIANIYSGNDSRHVNSELKKLDKRFDSMKQDIENIESFYQKQDQKALKVLTESQTKLASAIEKLEGDAESVKSVKEVMDAQQQLIKTIKERVE